MESLASGVSRLAFRIGSYVAIPVLLSAPLRAADALASPPRVGIAVRHAVSPKPLRELRLQTLHPAGSLPFRPPSSFEPPARPHPGRAIDPAVQQTPGPHAPSEILQFDGASQADNALFYPFLTEPDPIGAVGQDHYFHSVNFVFRIFDKGGNLVLGPLPNYAPWSGFGGVCEGAAFETGRMLVSYDAPGGRWVLALEARDEADSTRHECFAVSTTSDPTGTYALYDFILGSDALFPDKLGVWFDGYYLTANQAQTTGGIGIYAFDRQAMLAGLPATFQTVDTSATNPNTYFGLPSELDGLTAPPAGSPNFVMALGGPDVDGSLEQVVHLWRYHADFSDPNNSTFEGPIDLSVAPFESDLGCGPDPFFDGCIPQLDTNQLLRPITGRLMYRLAYRNFGDHEALVVNQGVNAASDGNQAGIRWYEIRDPNGTPLIFQQGTYVSEGSNAFIGSIAMDFLGNMALGYSKSDATIHPSLAVTGRLRGDPAGTMGTELMFFPGPASKDASAYWGNVAAMTIDPADGCTFWFTGEYMGPDPTVFDPWVGRIGAFKFESCTSGPTGVLEGTVTEVGSGAPVEGARVTAGASETLTSGSGHYQFLTLPAGTYDMTVTKFGLLPGSATGVVVTAGGTTTQDFVLDPAPQVLVNGVVKDGSGAGWPLYTKIRIAAPGFGGATLFSDPVTGYYAITLTSGATYTITVNAVAPGYTPAVVTLPLLPPAGNDPGGVIQNFALTVDVAICSAPGYELQSSGLLESFDGGVLPPGWSVVDNSPGGALWAIHSGPDPCGAFAGNLTGGAGPFALANHACDALGTTDTELVTPSVDMSSFSTAVIAFRQDYLSFISFDFVDVSVDGGANWTTVLFQDVDVRGPIRTSVDITALAAGQPDVRARFHYLAFLGFWWQVDDVLLGQASCVPRSGGLVVGNVRDANTGVGLNSATVVNLPNDGQTTTFATPEDPNQDDGFYILFAGSGPQPFQASHSGYAPQTKNISVIPNGARRLDFDLAAGLLDASPRPLSARVDPGGLLDAILTLTNSGGADASFEILEINGPAPASGAAMRGPFADPGKIARARARIPQGRRPSHDLRDVPRLPDAPVVTRPMAAGDVVASFPTGLVAPFSIAFNADANDFWVENDAFFGGDDMAHRFLTDGTDTGDAIDNSSWVTTFVNDGAYNSRTHKLWFASSGDTCIYEADPVAKVPTGNRICPAITLGSSTDGLAYDPISDTYYSGSFVDGAIYHFNGGGMILDSANVGLFPVGMAFHPSNGHLFVLNSHAAGDGTSDVYVLDPLDGYAVLGSFDITNAGAPAITDYGQGGMEIDCAGNLWLIDFLATTLIEAESGETAICDVFDIPWLSENPVSGTVAANSSLPVTVTFDSTGLTPGLRQGQLLFATDTPYPVAPVPVNFTVRFLDVPDGSFADNFIYGAAGAGIMPGCDPAAFLFCPDGVVTRADMAGFMERAVHGADFVPPAYAGIFADVQPGDYNADYIQGLFDDGITAGCGNGNFCPTNPNTRAQMAVFVEKGLRGGVFVPPTCMGIFVDVPCPATPEFPYSDWIELLYGDGITVGCQLPGDPLAYCPDQDIPNAQMAVFLVKAFAIPHL